MVIPDDGTRGQMSLDWAIHVGKLTNEQIDAIYECMEYKPLDLLARDDAPFLFAVLGVVICFLGSGHLADFVDSWHSIDPDPDTMADRVLAMLEVRGTPNAAALAIVERARRKIS